MIEKNIDGNVTIKTKQNLNNKQRISIRNIALIALFSALTAICSFLCIPSAIPFTLQTFAICFALEMLGGRRGVYSILVYLLIGATGLPVFSGFTGGIAMLFGPTGGYLLGFLAMGAVYCAVTYFFGRKAPVRVAALVSGTVVCYLLGTIWFVWICTARGSIVSFSAALLTCVVPYLLPDALKLILAMTLATRLRKLRFFRISPEAPIVI